MPEPSATPLLTLAIPTYNRADRLPLLLDILLPQVAAAIAAAPASIQLIISDNASTDATPQVIADAVTTYAAHGILLETLRNPENLGPDGNFLGCIRAARGHFFWICGDDDIIVTGGLAEVLAQLREPSGAPADIDMLHVTSYGFRNDFLSERQHDPYNRTVHTITDVHSFVLILNVMLTFVSGNIINRTRFNELPHEDPADYLGTWLIQLSWVLPFLPHFRRAKILWTRPLAVRQGHANGYSLGKVFGANFVATVHRLLPARPDLADPILHAALRRWFPGILLDLRIAADPTLRFHEAGAQLRQAFGANPRFWLFTWPVLTLPLPLARLWAQATAFASKVLYVVRLPGIRKR